MCNSITFDCSNFYYSVNGINPPVAHPKERGKTYETIQALFAAKAYSEGDLLAVSLFTKELTKHVEGSIKRRYGIFSHLILYFGRMGWGALGSLYHLQEFYTQKTNAKLFQEFKATQSLEILGNIFTLDPASQTGIDEVDARYMQLKAINSSLSASETIKLAWTLTKRTNEFVQGRLKKTANGDIPRTIFYDHESKRYFICLKQKGEKIVAETDVKKITKAILVPQLAEKAEIVVQKTTQDDLSKIMREVTYNEYTIARKLKGDAPNWPPGICPIHYAVRHEKHKDDKTYEKVSLFEPFGEGSFSRFCKTATFSEVVQATKELVQGLKLMHDNILVHGDVKNSNTQTFGKKVVWIDFGLTCPAHREGAHSIFRAGYYGTLAFSAPEYISARGFEGKPEDYIRMDIWALGLMLFRKWLKKETSSWSKIAPKSTGVELDYDEKAAYKAAIANAVLPPLSALLQKQSLTKEEQFTALIYKLMHPEANERLTTEMALRELDVIQSRCL